VLKAAIASFLVCLAAASPAQLYKEIWRHVETIQPSSGGPIAFIKNDRTLNFRVHLIEEDGPYPFIDCRDARGNLLWTRPTNNIPTAIMATTDDFVYSVGGNWIRAMNQDGEPVWETQVAGPMGSSTYSSMRIFGDLLLVAGTSVVTPGSSGTSEPVLVALNRFSGLLHYRRPFGAPLRGAAVRDLASSGGKVFLNQFSGASQILKIEPETGNVLGSFEGDSRGMAVDSIGNVYATSGNKLRKFSTAVPGDFQLVFEKAYDQYATMHDVLLSSGFVYLTEQTTGEWRGPTVIRKVRPSDGESMWETTWLGDDYSRITYLSADKYGRITACSAYSRASEVAVNLYGINPTDGSVVERLFLYSNYDSSFLGNGHSGIAMNGFGEIAVSAMNGQKELTRLIGQTIETFNDSYTAPANTVFSSEGAGLLKNDRFANPANCDVTIVSPPEAGTLTMHANGEFTFDTRGIPDGSYSFTYRVTRNLETVDGQATLTVRRGLSGLSLTRNQLAGQNATLGTVTVAQPGSATTVQIWDDSSLVTTPASVSIPAGQTQANFGVQVVAVNATIKTTVYASNGGITRSTPLALVPLVPTAMAFTPSSTVTGGTTVTCRLVINGVAGPGGRTISIYDNSAYTSVPSQVVVPPGQTQVFFTITTLPTATLQTSRITAAVSAGTVSAYLRVKP